MKNEQDRYFNYYDAYESLMLLKMTEHSDDKPYDINEVKEAIQRNIDQGATENLRDLPHYVGAEFPWIKVNGVIRRYGYSR